MDQKSEGGYIVIQIFFNGSAQTRIDPEELIKGLNEIDEMPLSFLKNDAKVNFADYPIDGRDDYIYRKVIVRLRAEYQDLIKEDENLKFFINELAFEMVKQVNKKDEFTNSETRK
jgi:hypothetical protein